MVLKILITFFLAQPAFGFVLLSGPDEAKLPVSPEQPILKFQVQLKAPNLKKKEEFLDGQYADLSDEDFWLVLIQEAMKPWNTVSTAYVELQAEFNGAAELNSEDGIFTIQAGETNETSAAYAAPSIEENRIIDCDIVVSSRSAEAKRMAFTLMHELGHCLGLGHNHADYSAVMGYSRLDNQLSLGLDDEAGLTYLYPEANVGPARELVSCGLLASQTRSPSAFFAILLPLFLLGLNYLKRATYRMRLWKKN